MTCLTVLMLAHPLVDLNSVALPAVIQAFTPSRIYKTLGWADLQLFNRCWHAQRRVTVFLDSWRQLPNKFDFGPKGKLGNPLQNLVLMSEDRFKISKEYVNTYCIVNKPALSTVANKHKIKLPEKYFNKELLNFFWF